MKNEKDSRNESDDEVFEFETETGKSRLTRMSNFILKFDIFAQEHEIMLQNGKRKLQSHCGVVLGLIMISILVFYANWKFTIMINYENNSIQTPREINFFESEYVYRGEENGWRVAFNLIAYDSSSDQDPISEAYGNMYAAEYIWGEKDENGNIKGTYKNKLATKPCALTDINMDGSGEDDEFVFFTPDKSYKSDIQRFYPQLLCLENENRLRGDYNTAEGIILNLGFEVCRDKPICHSEAKIMNWLRRKFIVVLENTLQFDRENVSNNGILKGTRLSWNVVSPQLRTEYSNKLAVTQLDLLDKIMDIGFRREEKQLFDLKSDGFRVWDFPDNVQCVVSYEFNRDLTTVRRKVYSILEFLGDLGGLAGSLVALFTVSVLIFQYKTSINYMSTWTYVTESQGGRLDRINVGFWYSIKLSLQRVFMICNCCICCHSKRDRTVHTADRAIKSELKIVKWIQFFRALELAFTKLFTRDEWKQIEKEAKYRKVYIDDNGEPCVSNELYDYNQQAEKVLLESQKKEN